MSIFKCNQRNCNGFGKPDVALHNDKFYAPVREGSTTNVEWRTHPQPKPCLKCGDCGHSWIPSDLDAKIEMLEQKCGVSKQPLTNEQWEWWANYYKTDEDVKDWLNMSGPSIDDSDVDIISPFD